MKLLFTLLLLSALYRLPAQTYNVIMEVKGTPLTVLKVTECVDVYREVTDSVISDATGTIHRMLGRFPTGLTIPRLAVQHFHREFFNDNGVFWTRLTNDRVVEDKSKLVLDPITDSVYEWRRLPNFFAHDTIMQINPVTLEEEIFTQIDSSPLHTHFHLGGFSKAELKAAIETRLGIDKYSPYQLKGVDVVFLTDDGKYTYVDYAQPTTLQQANKIIDELPPGTTVLLGYYKLFNQALHYPIDCNYDVCDLQIKE